MNKITDTDMVNSIANNLLQDHVQLMTENKRLRDENEQLRAAVADMEKLMTEVMDMLKEGV